MRFPRILLAVPFIAAGIWLPAFTAPPVEPAPFVIGMVHEGFAVPGVEEVSETPVITIAAGETLTFQNNSRWIHILGPGEHGLLAAPGQAGISPRVMLQENDSYTTDPWTTPGTYHITCPVHPDMNATVIVEH